MVFPSNKEVTDSSHAGQEHDKPVHVMLNMWKVTGMSHLDTVSSDNQSSYEPPVSVEGKSTDQ